MLTVLMSLQFVISKLLKIVFSLCYYSVQLCILLKWSECNMKVKMLYIRMLIVSGLKRNTLELEIFHISFVCYHALQLAFDW
jgi:hypothetical protein